LCINESLELGSILPYLKKIRVLPSSFSFFFANYFVYQERDWGVIVFNPNMNSVEVPDQSGADLRCKEAFLSRKKVVPTQKGRRKIPGNESNGDHCIYVWDHFGTKSAASQICIIAHSAGKNLCIPLGSSNL